MATESSNMSPSSASTSDQPVPHLPAISARAAHDSVSAAREYARTSRCDAAGAPHASARASHVSACAYRASIRAYCAALAPPTPGAAPSPLTQSVGTTWADAGAAWADAGAAWAAAADAARASAVDADAPTLAAVAVVDPLDGFVLSAPDCADAAATWADIANDWVVVVSSSRPPAAAPPLTLAAAFEAEIVPEFSTRYMNKLVALIDNLGETEKDMSSLLKFFGIQKWHELSKKFDLSKPINPADYLQFVFHGILVVGLMFMAQKRSPRLTQRFIGAAVLCVFAHILFMLLYGMPSPILGVFFGACAVIFYIWKRMTT